MAKKIWDRQKLRDHFNSLTREIHAVYDAIGDQFIKSVGLDMDLQTGEPFIRFDFKAGTNPDLGKLPPTLGELPVRYTFSLSS